MFSRIKNFFLAHEPFKPAHMGNWIRGFYFCHYLPLYVKTEKVHEVLDAGCGAGQYTERLAKYFPHAHVLGLDIVESDLWKVRKSPNAEFRVGDLRLLDDSERFDLVSSIDVLEHIIGNEVVLHRIFRSLKRGGILYLAVPCEPEEWRIFPRSWFVRFNEWEKNEHIGEQRSLGELVALMEEIGYQPLLARRTFALWGALAWEIETLLHEKEKWGRPLNLLLMPFYKMLGMLDLYFPIGKGHNLVIARKSK